MTRNNAAALALLLVMALIVPLIPSDYMFDAILTPFLAVSLAALGLNLLAGYTGQVSLGSAAFMAVGAFSAYNFLIRLPGLPLLAAFLLAGVVAAVLGVVFGLPSLRLRGFYLAISTLAAQFFVQWALTTLDWFSDGDTSGVITTPPLNIAGLTIDSPVRRYLLSLAVVALLTLVAIRLVRSRAGHDFLAVRDNELAARILGVPVLRTKLFLYLRTVEPAGFDLDRSFEILFVIIIGGLASIRGAFLGAAFIVVLPLLLSRAGGAIFGATFDSGLVDIVEKIILGVLIIFFLRVEPAGLSALLARLPVPRFVFNKNLGSVS
jgi:branched-chain amino acid transport system permease protein